MSNTTAIRSASHFDVLAEKIANRTARVGIVGLGYVGLPLAVEFANAGFSVTGIDALHSKVQRINAGGSYVQDVPSEEISKLVERGNSALHPIFRWLQNWTP